MNPTRIRNFSIIAHIDHGKSTLADRLLEYTQTVSPREMKDQVLDNMELERERGITIKSHAVRMEYTADDGEQYIFNLIDTPGHVDFSYEVSRSLAACEGALLLVDASQGVQAQTVSNLLLAMENDLAIIPIINKIDIKNIHIGEVVTQLHDLLGVTEEEIVKVSAKEGWGTQEVLEAIVERIPPPRGDLTAPLRALIFDSVFDRYQGAVAYIRVVDGTITPGMPIVLHSTQRRHETHELGYLRLGRVEAASLSAGEVGYLICGIKEVREAHVGDTIMEAARPAMTPLPGYREVKPMVFSGIYPLDSEEYEDLRDALDKLRLNDSSLSYEPETSVALGFGFRCGFLGLLHMEIVRERLEREHELRIINTVPSVEYRVILKDGETVTIDNPAKLPPQVQVEAIEEPILSTQILTPAEYVGNLMRLIMERRGIHTNTEYLDPRRVAISCDLPLAEIVIDFYDRLKSVSRGYATFDYDYKTHRPSDLIKLDILLNGEPVDALSMIVHREKAYGWGMDLCKRLRELIPRQLFEVIIQGAIGGKIISRETIRPLRKNVTAKCYGGDITRKRKLLEKQKEGKKRMKQVGRVEIPQEAFLAVLRLNGEGRN